MKRGKLIYGIAGAVLLALAVMHIVQEPYRPKTVIASADGCNMSVDVLEPPSGEVRGSVVMFHGISSNKRVMAYLAADFANQDLRVFSADLPGHGRTPGPFTFARAESCAESLVKELTARMAIAPSQTILVGHSLGGAIALHIANKTHAAGVIAISPAPDKPSGVMTREMLPYGPEEISPRNILVLTGGWEPSAMRAAREAMAQRAPDHSGTFVEIPGEGHVGVILANRTLTEMRAWLHKTLGTNPDAPRATHIPFHAFLVGTAGLCFLVIPFLWETVTKAPAASDTESASEPRYFVAILKIAGASIVAVLLLHFFVPLRFIHVFQGDYFASFALIAGFICLFLAPKNSMGFSIKSATSVFVAALILLFLFGLWFDWTFYEAWLSGARWLRFPLMLLALLPFAVAEEVFLGPPVPGKRLKRFAFSFLFKFVAWLAIFAGVALLHSAQILMVLLVFYFAMFFVLQRLAMDFVHKQTRSTIATALFGAILLAGFALAIFPVG